jgi:diguanylate cyclase (GGDEF)-like protein/PAS domain S-box-containing protein
MHCQIHSMRADGTPFPVEECRIFQAFKKGEGTHVDDEVLWRADGTSFPAEYWSYPQRQGGVVVGAVVTFLDITERKLAEEKMAHLSRQNELILNSAAEGILGVDLQGNHTFVNSAAAKMLGYKSEELIGRPSHSTWHHTKADGSPYPQEECEILSAFREETVHRVSTEVFWRKDGTSFPVEYASTPVYEQGQTAGVVVTFADITERKKTEEEIQHLATHDLLTDLPSLGLARDRLSSAINMARRYKKAVALMFVDLDGFKTVNDTLGHDAGDYVLQQVALRLLSCVRETDTVARLGGDEFLIIATEINAPENASQIAEKVIQTVSRPIIFKKRQAIVGASIGIALFPDHGEDMNQLIKQADKAMYSVKNAGKNGFRFANAATK